MDHSVRAYLERFPLDKLISLIDDGSFQQMYAEDPAIDATCVRLADRQKCPKGSVSAYSQNTRTEKKIGIKYGTWA